MRRYIDKYEKEGKGEKKGERKVRHARKRNEAEMRPVSQVEGAWRREQDSWLPILAAMLAKPLFPHSLVSPPIKGRVSTRGAQGPF